MVYRRRLELEATCPGANKHHIGYSIVGTGQCSAAAVGILNIPSLITVIIIDTP